MRGRPGNSEGGFFWPLAIGYWPVLKKAIKICKPVVV